MTNNLIFYDTETTGLVRDFAQILQCGSIQTNRKLELQGEQNLGCAPLPWVIPHPKGMLTNKKTHLFNSNVSHYELIRDLNRQWREWTIDEPALFISFNGIFFDEERSFSICGGTSFKANSKIFAPFIFKKYFFSELLMLVLSYIRFL